jgi:hypothetical protein
MKYVGILIFTVIEVAGLAIGLALWLSGNIAVSIVVQLVAFTAEHYVSYNVKNSRPFFEVHDLPFSLILIVAVIETVTWSGWLALLDQGNGILAAIVLFGGLEFGHGLELNVVNNFPITRRLGNRFANSLDITAIEGVFGIIWRVLVLAGSGIAGVVVLAVAIFIEHVISSNKKISA